MSSAPGGNGNGLELVPAEQLVTEARLHDRLEYMLAPMRRDIAKLMRATENVASCVNALSEQSQSQTAAIKALTKALRKAGLDA